MVEIKVTLLLDVAVQESTAVLKLLAGESNSVVVLHPGLMSSIGSEDSNSRVMVKLLVGVFTKICMLPRRWRTR